jgi:hypothetical protein
MKIQNKDKTMFKIAILLPLLVIGGYFGIIAYQNYQNTGNIGGIHYGDVTMPTTLSLQIVDHNGQPVNAHVMIFNMSETPNPSMIYQQGLPASPNFQILGYTFGPNTLYIRVDVENPDNINQAAFVTLHLTANKPNKATITLSG